MLIITLSSQYFNSNQKHFLRPTIFYIYIYIFIFFLQKIKENIHKSGCKKLLQKIINLHGKTVLNKHSC